MAVGRQKDKMEHPRSKEKGALPISILFPQRIYCWLILLIADWILCETARRFFGRRHHNFTDVSQGIVGKKTEKCYWGNYKIVFQDVFEFGVYTGNCITS